MRHALHPLGFALVLLTSPVFAQVEPIEIDDDEVTRAYIPNISPEFVDPSAHSRFHLTGRVTFSDVAKPPATASVWSYDAFVALNVAEGLALTVALPFGLEAPQQGTNQFFVGNISLGVQGGLSVPLSEPRGALPPSPELRLGGALDYYVPTRPSFDPANCPGGLPCDPARSVRFLRTFEPGRFMTNATGFRARVHGDIRINWITAELELGLSPFWTLESESTFAMWVHVGGRVRALVTNSIEPYLEVLGDVQTAGPDEPRSAILTPGIRFHFLGMDPAIFASIPLKSGGVIFGIDLAAAERKSKRTEREGWEDPLDFP